MNDYLVGALSIGIDYDTFWHLTPAELDIFVQANSNKKRQKDWEAWLNGQYTMKAVSVAIDHALNGSKAKSKYFEDPILWKILDESELTEEERERRAMEAEIAKMNQWIENDRRRGLPETKVC